jgi:Phosphatidylinositol-specific phospholipase C, X domain
MAELIQVAPEIKLRELVIPGTHDSASYSLTAWTLFSAAGRTQNVSVYEQLLRGARYLDIRVAGSNQHNAEDVYIFHGCLRCAKLDSILKEIKVFMDLHPQEFIFLEIVPEYGRLYTDEQKLHTLKLVQETFGNKIYTGRSYNQLLNRWSLAQVVNGQKKTMCVMVHPRIYKFEVDDVEYLEDNILDEFGFVNSHRWMRNHWHNTRDIELLKEWNLEEVKKYGPQDKKLLNNQIILTPGVGGPLDVAKLILGGNSLRPVSFAAALYKSEVLDVFFRDNANQAW